MNVGVFVIMGVMLTVVAVVMGALPAVMRPTLPLGVSVPASRLDEPVIRRAIRRFRLLIAIIWVACLVLLAVLAATAPPAMVLVSVYLYVIAQVVAYVIARQMIVKAKHDGDWYHAVPVRMAATVTAPTERGPVPAGWFAASVLLLVCAYAVGIVLYPSLPATLPTHWGLNGQADRYADKTVWVVFAPLLIGTVVIAGLFALSFLGRVVPVRALPGADAATNAHRDHEMRAAMSSLIGRLMFLLAVEFSWTTLAARLLPGPARPALVGSLVIVALILVMVVLFVVRWRRLMLGDARLIAAERTAHATVDTPDDDRYWKAGIFYVNGDDPALVVQRRMGVGWTLNFGHPAGVIVGVVILVVIVAVITFALTHAATRGA